jgi:hypothetical protein
MSEWATEDGWAGGAEALSEANAKLSDKPTPKQKSWDDQMDDYDEQNPKRKPWYES